jgi:hypothetical protein
MSPEIVRLLLEHGADPQATVPSPSSAEAVGVDKGKSAQQAAQLKQRTLEVPGPTCQAADDWLLEDIGILAGGHALHLATRAHSMVDAKDPKVCGCVPTNHQSKHTLTHMIGRKAHCFTAPV